MPTPYNPGPRWSSWSDGVRPCPFVPRGRQSVARVTGGGCVRPGCLGVTVCVLLATPQVWPLTRAAVYSAPLLAILALPGEGRTQPAVHRMCPRHSLSAATGWSPPLPRVRTQARPGAGVGPPAWGGLSGPRNEGEGRGANGPDWFRLIPAPPLTSWVPDGAGVDGMNPVASGSRGGPRLGSGDLLLHGTAG